MLVQPLHLGEYPTPVFALRNLRLPGGDLWVKDDSQTSSVYGGNKVRKLEWILGDALARGAKRIVTVGAAGSHHVLASTVFARQVGLPCAAVLLPQPWTAHAELTLSAGLGQGLEPYPARGGWQVLPQLARCWRRGDYWIGAGGSCPLGAAGYCHAVRELAAQIATGELPEPDWIVTALGSGGTIAGLLAGLGQSRLRTRILGVSVALQNRAVAYSWTAHLARRTGSGKTSRWGSGLLQPDPFVQGQNWPALRQRLIVSVEELGRGYGYATARGEAAAAIGTTVGLALDTTYTAKAFAAALELLGCPLPSAPAKTGVAKETAPCSTIAPLKVLYWHTLSRAPLEPLAKQAVGSGIRGWQALPKELQSLWLENS